MGFLRTKRGYDLGEVVSALQKAIRRADARMAGYWAVEMFESGFDQYAWRRILTVSAEDCWGIITHEITALHTAYNTINATTTKGKRRGRIFLSKAVILLSMARKSRDADHLQNLAVDQRQGISDEQIEADIDEARKNPEKVPEYAFDCHTNKGRRAGKTKEDFFRDEQAALEPKEPGLFDDLVK